MKYSRRKFLHGLSLSAGGIFVPRIVRGFPGPALPFYGAKSGAALDPVATDWANRVVGNGGAIPSAKTQTVFSDFVTGCKADSVWTPKLIIANCIAPDGHIA